MKEPIEKGPTTRRRVLEGKDNSRRNPLFKKKKRKKNTSKQLNKPTLQKGTSVYFIALVLTASKSSSAASVA